MVPTPTKAFAVENNIKVLQPAKIRKNEEFFSELRNLKPDIIVVVAYGKILPEEILTIPKYGCMNVHASLLPKFRGAAPIQWSIINGEKVTGITTMKMDAGMDTGDIYLKEEVAIDPDDTYGTLYDKLKRAGGSLAVKTLDLILDDTIKPKKQEGEFTIAPMIFKEQCKIDYMKSAYAICNLVRGVNPIPGAWTEFEDKVLKIWKATEVDEKDFDEASLNEHPGTVIVSDEKIGLFVNTASGVLSILEIQAPNGKRMNISDFLRGNKIPIGTILK